MGLCEDLEAALEAREKAHARSVRAATHAAVRASAYVGVDDGQPQGFLRLQEAALAAERRVLERHAPVDHRYGVEGLACERCNDDDGDPARYPCDEARDLAARLGIEVPA